MLSPIKVALMFKEELGNCITMFLLMVTKSVMAALLIPPNKLSLKIIMRASYLLDFMQRESIRSQWSIYSICTMGI
ncbi:uncharacterized protein DS421_19g666210 [Arachis hypogaea]|uniref:Uncharacterized protein n=1 Tax=Arachis hypogaea TaxID=3818 RepID=A0A6B9VFN8_ARAHY|nr:uncharacterized protein DS421_19g666210 [Arachis hypogaea]